jgi:hypothetical protein
LRFFQSNPTCVTRHEGKQQLPSSSLLPFQSSPQSEKKKVRFPKKTQIQKQQHTHKKATTGPQKKGQIPNIEGGGGMDSKSDGDGKCRGGASELKPANRA